MIPCLRKISIVCQQGDREKSWFREDKIGGEINCRNSSTLLKWAMEAMNEQTTGFLCEEFESYINRSRSWGAFCMGNIIFTGIDRQYNGKKDKGYCVTDEFQRLRIKNWPARIEMRLYEDTKRRMCRDKEFRKLAVGRAEKIIYTLDK